MTRPRNGDDPCGPLRQVLDEACAAGSSMDEATVLAPQNDPYRQDTARGHTEARWFQRHFNAAIQQRGTPRLHLRGVHYALVSAKVKKPNGKPYTNTDEDWAWLQGGPAKAARWLGYVPFTAITDNRADAPTIREPGGWQPSPQPHVSTGLNIDLAGLTDLGAVVGCDGFAGVQPYRLVIFGEKSSLADVVGPIADHYRADLFLETGEISDSHIYEMAAAGAEDGRPMRVFTLADCDPAGWQMPVSIGRKLQALRDFAFAGLDFAVLPVALTVDQVRALRLPSTPLKAKEQRGDKWRAAWGIEQTEIDALATLQPRVLADLLTEALGNFYDATLDRRVAKAEEEWRREAQAAIDAQVDADDFEEIRAEVETIQSALTAIDDRLHASTADVELPEAVIPTAAIAVNGHAVRPLVDSDWDWAEQTRRLKAWKAYEPDEAEA